VQDYLTAHGRMNDAGRGRFVALIGDAELDEGNIYEAIIEGAKHDVRNLWWIVDYNRQSLDATSADRMFERFDEIFRSCGWRVVELRYGRKLKAALDENEALKGWFEQLSNAELSALHYQGGAAWRARIEAELGKKAATFLKQYDDAALGYLFTDLCGQCLE
jgi:pyruvate dehydrogenase E1 component